eukprot:g7540.t1
MPISTSTIIHHHHRTAMNGYWKGFFTGLASAVGAYVLLSVSSRVVRHRHEVVQKGRVCAFVNKGLGKDPFVVFLIGARVNSYWRLLTSLSFKHFAEFGRLADILFASPRKWEPHGLLYQTVFGDAFSGTGSCTVQYWKDYQSLEQFALEQKDHLAAWNQWRKDLQSSGALAIWHETYLVQDYEVIADNAPQDMLLWGLGAKHPELAVLAKAEGPLARGRGRMEHARTHFSQ